MRSAIAAVMLFALSACKRNPIPADVLPPEKMQKVLWDYLNTDVYVQEFLKQDSSQNADRAGALYYAVVYKKNNTDAAGFKRSFAFYSEHPDVMSPMLDSMLAVYSRQTEKMRKLPILKAE